MASELLSRHHISPEECGRIDFESRQMGGQTPHGALPIICSYQKPRYPAFPLIGSESVNQSEFVALWPWCHKDYVSGLFHRLSTFKHLPFDHLCRVNDTMRRSIPRDNTLVSYGQPLSGLGNLAAVLDERSCQLLWPTTIAFIYSGHA